METLLATCSHRGAEPQEGGGTTRDWIENITSNSSNHKIYVKIQDFINFVFFFKSNHLDFKLCQGVQRILQRVTSKLIQRPEC